MGLVVLGGGVLTEAVVELGGLGVGVSAEVA